MSSRKNQKRANQIVRARLAAERRRRTMIWTAVIVVAVLVVAGVAGYAIYANQQAAARARNYAMPHTSTRQDLGLVASQGPVRVDLYVDFMCPHCKEFEQTAGPVLNDFIQKKRIKLVYHPLNILDSAGINYSARSAAGAGCAADAGQLLKYVTNMYAKQPEEGSSGYSDDQIVKTSGISDSTFAKCVKSEKYLTWVAHVAEQAAPKVPQGTPTIYVAGKMLQETSVDALTKAINAG